MLCALHGRANRTLVWALTVASVVLLLPILLLETPHPLSEAWLQAGVPGTLPLFFEPAPSLVIGLEPVAQWPTEEDGSSAQEDEMPAPKPAYDALRWLNEHPLPLRSAFDSNRLQYKLDPEFGFEDRSLRVNGMMLRLRIEF